MSAEDEATAVGLLAELIGLHMSGGSKPPVSLTPRPIGARTTLASVGSTSILMHQEATRDHELTADIQWPHTSEASWMPPLEGKRRYCQDMGNPCGPEAAAQIRKDRLIAALGLTGGLVALFTEHDRVADLSLRVADRAAQSALTHIEACERYRMTVGAGVLAGLRQPSTVQTL